jgi:hypothetical protein
MHEHARALDVAQKAIAETGTLMRPFDQSGDVDHHEGLKFVDAHDAQLRFERRERIVGNFGTGRGNDREQRRLSGVRQSDDSAIREQLELEPKVETLAAFAELREARRLSRRSREMLIAEATLAAPCDDQTLAGNREVGDPPDARCPGLAFILIDDRSDGDADDQIGAGLAGLVGCSAGSAGFGREVLLEAEIDQRRKAGVSLEGDVAALAAVPAGGAALGDVLLSPPRDNSVPALSGGDGYRDFINKLRLASL